MEREEIKRLLSQRKLQIYSEKGATKEVLDLMVETKGSSIEPDYVPCLYYYWGRGIHGERWHGSGREEKYMLVYNIETGIIKDPKIKHNLTAYSSELHERQKELEKDILGLILAFNKDTNLLPRSITLETSDISGIRDTASTLKRVTIKGVILDVPLSY